MKNKRILSFGLSSLLVIAAALALTGCATTSETPTDKVDVALKYVRPATRLACVIGIEEGAEEADRIKLAQEIYNVSVLIESLSTGKFPTPLELKQILEKKFPKDRKYIALALSLTDIYKNATAQLSTVIDSEKSPIVIKYLHEMAVGCREAAELYIKIPE
jgi:hypothetical protein